MNKIILLWFLVFLTTIYCTYFPAIPKRKKHYRYALLLGCPSFDDGSMRSSQIKRCQLAIQAYKDGLFDTLVIAGGAVKNQYVESEEMKSYITQQIQMPIVCETRSTNTFDNFRFSKEIIGNQSVLILTSGTHARRACAIARQFFTNYGCLWYPEHRPRHIFRAIISRMIYIAIEIKKLLLSK